ncbi:hypothetical protein [Paenibacillus sp. YIM B09110]|uniref:hypothetical protein n=1 Tax=Paenibacillus sp. YIM B09110 TaxID=3126102 RepID=UPI00301BD088
MKEADAAAAVAENATNWAIKGRKSAGEWESVAQYATSKARKAQTVAIRCRKCNGKLLDKRVTVAD